ncbi:MAG: hypothetical protein MUD12_11330 [Spirochaetes bacterium]|jgi:hypothetical protein|nr:hypothetical protein [Spirochaetota bacterium]
MDIEKRLKKYYGIKTRESGTPADFSAVKRMCRFEAPAPFSGLTVSLRFYGAVCLVLAALAVSGSLYTSPIHGVMDGVFRPFNSGDAVFAGLNGFRVLVRKDLEKNQGERI